MDIVGAMDFFTSPDGIICLITGAIIGGAISQFLQGWKLSLVMSIIVGAIGGVIGGYIFDLINIIDVGDYADPIIAAVVGAAVVLGLARLLRG